MKSRHLIAVAAACGACVGHAQAQDSGLSFTLGLRAWATEWTTFSYSGDPANLVLTQSPAKNSLLVMPVLGVRYGDFVGSVSMMPSTRFDFGAFNGTRREWDVNLGYTFLPGLTATLGYKYKRHGDASVRYVPKGPIVGLNASAQINGPLSLYGIVALGKLKTSDKDAVNFKADYRLSEVGLAYALDIGRPSPRLSLTAGWRTQTLSSKDALPSQDGLDTTQGLTLGLVSTF
jgi:hypothetical protein